MLFYVRWGLLLLAWPTEVQCEAIEADVAEPRADGNVLVRAEADAEESVGSGCQSQDMCESMTAVGFLQTHVDLSADSLRNLSLGPWIHSAQKLSLGGSVVLACFLLVLSFASTDTLLSSAIFLDLFMTTILTPLAPTLTPSYQHIALLTSSKNIVTCLIAPFTGRFIDGNEAKSMQLGMLCAVLCSLSMAVVKDYWFWLAVRCVSGCSTAAVVWGGFALCNQVHADEATARTKAMSMLTAGLYAGVILGPQAGGLFVEDSRSLFVLLSAAQTCTFIALRLRLPDLSQHQKQKQKKSERAVDMVGLILDPDVRNPIVALFLALSFIAALGSTAFEYMIRLGYDQMRQNLTWLMSSVPAILFVYLVPALRSILEGKTLQIVAMLVAGGAALFFFDTNYILLALTLLGSAAGAGIVDGNTPAMLADCSQEKYGGTGQVFVLSNVADQAAFVLGPAGGSVISQHVSFPLMCQSFGGCMVLYGLYLSMFAFWRPQQPVKSGNSPDSDTAYESSSST
mmetsp:Transcript_27103/g.55883  ORF Transcript_27103/g.55883 Transcript_27103/m.55883 type:complete len:512 (-) Transcript_27103:297-1832(-)|eukprot:s6186_g1.t1